MAARLVAVGCFADFVGLFVFALKVTRRVSTFARVDLAAMGRFISSFIFGILLKLSFRAHLADQ